MWMVTLLYIYYKYKLSVADMIAFGKRLYTHRIVYHNNIYLSVKRRAKSHASVKYWSLRFRSFRFAKYRMDLFAYCIARQSNDVPIILLDS